MQFDTWRSVCARNYKLQAINATFLAIAFCEAGSTNNYSLLHKVGVTVIRIISLNAFGMEMCINFPGPELSMFRLERASIWAENWKFLVSFFRPGHNDTCTEMFKNVEARVERARLLLLRSKIRCYRI